MVLFIPIMDTPLLKLINTAGGQSALARLSGVPQATISAWVNRFQHRVGADFVIKLCESVEWKITPHQLRPDIYPHPNDGLPESLRAA